LELPARKKRFLFVTFIGALAGLLSARRAAAEIKIVVKDGWRLTTDGRINNFLSVARGNWIPNMEPPYTGVDDEPTSGNEIASSRVRTGFLQSVMGLELNKQIGDDTNLKMRFAFWALTASLRTALDSPPAEAREAYFKLEGNWGGILVGRALGLFSRGAIMLDYEVEHGFGVGFPCATKEVRGGACGHAGFGLLFPGFHSGFVYNTPRIGGLQLSVGMYDPIQFAASNYRRTPYPRPEAELTFATPNRLLTAFVGAIWQRISATLMGGLDPVTMLPTKVDHDFNAQGVNYGVGLNLGPLMLGFSGFAGKGLGVTVPLEDNPAIILSGRPGLRSEDGYWGAAALVFGGTKLAAGAGITRAKRDYADPDPETTPNVPYIARQLGFSAGIYQTVFKMVTLAAEYFGAQFTWFDRMTVNANGDAFVERPRQLVHFVNVGATLAW
jgi:hypothetical protein